MLIIVMFLVVVFCLRRLDLAVDEGMTLGRRSLFVVGSKVFVHHGAHESQGR